MGRPKRQVYATIEDTITPPDVLSEAQSIARAVKGEGKNIYSVELPGGKQILAELEAKFRSTVWIKRGSYVVVDMSGMAERDNKLAGEIINVVRDEKAWRKMSYWYVPKLMLGIYSMLITVGPRSSSRSPPTRIAMKKSRRLGRCRLLIRTRSEPTLPCRGPPR
jgi:probable RNA-binding protein EIF1AD